MTRNVVFVVLDTVRKDCFDEYAPRLRSKSDLSFEQARAASSWSVPSHTSIFTGRLPHTHGVHAERFDADFSFSSLDRDDTFLGRLPDHRTVGLSANAYMNSFFEFDSLFDAFHDFSIGSHTNESLFPEALTVEEAKAEVDHDSAAERYLAFLRACLSHDHPGKSVANGAWSLLGDHYRRLPVPEPVDDGATVISDRLEDEADGDEPFFAFVNYMDAHTPLRNLRQYDQDLHDVPDTWRSTELDKWELNRDGKATTEYTENYRALYRTAVDYLDRTVSQLIDDVRAQTDRETTFVIVSDHGHNLGYPADDEEFHHTATATEGVLHTPCEVVNPPDGYPETEHRYFSHLDLGELVVRLAHDEEYDDRFGRDRVAAETVGLLGTGDGTWNREFTDDEYAYWNRMIRCVYDGDTKYQWNSLDESYAYELDPDTPSWQSQRGAEVDVPPFATEQFDVPIQTYKDRAAAAEQSMEFDTAVESRLEELGYL
ncbi:hypothetical protein BV210_17965 (plasmid) [Halorientalis sp. IM1011]|uniref:sulfatase-like hydrolase/transferase n=1 Tax=Halorientalis sp. IM1011 TaxID=1932360 RepID=UPI00097CD1F6|nr:sulfatase-like hydrolase/transferase [Halorientalis sp. IM1011]AQL44652.1 hypothetical protein BV210_17965 [Halorientalis sp. IM1011]